MVQNVRRIDSSEIENIFLDGKIVAIRWDLLEWGLIMDFDYIKKDSNNTKYTGRGWLVFYGVSAIWCPINEARIVNGIFVNSTLYSQEVEPGYIDFCFIALLPTFDASDNIKINPAKEIKIRCKSINGIASTAVGQFGQFGPHYAQRQKLCSDDEMMKLL